jgi:putative ABC transport system ATP-binding protein
MLKAEGLVKKYGKSEAVVYAVNGIDIDFDEGEFATITGKSGSGKTTLLHMLGGLLPPDSGDVIFNNQSIYKLNDKELSAIRRTEIAVIFQTFNLIPDMTAEDNILLPLKLDGRKVEKDYFSDIIHTLELEERLNHLPREMSGGQQQRTAIARALINHPKVMLCDEPTGNLDEASSKAVVNLLKTVNEKYNTTVILVTHDNAIANTSKKIIRLLDGKLQLSAEK